MNRTFSLLFYIKRSKPQPDGTVPVYIRITIDGKRAEIASKRNVIADTWNPEAQKVKGTTEDVRSLNSYFKSLERQLFDAYGKLLEKNKQVTAEMLKNVFTGVEEKQRMFISIFEEHNRQVEKLIGKEFTKSTHYKYNTTLKHCKDFLRWKYKLKDISIKEFDHAFITDFEFFLKSEKNCDHNTVAKYIKHVKKIINSCLANGWLTTDPFRNYKIKIRQVNREFLSDAELTTIQEKRFTTARLELVKDIFVFSCFTGLAYIDVFKLTPANIVIGIDGERWIYTTRQKTDTISHIPLLPAALAIIEKYSAHPKVVNENRLLPVLSNQKMNAYLKELADLCAITKELTFHIARHTFATTVTLNNDVPIETVSKMLGHKSIRTTQHYAKLLDKKVSLDMATLRQKLNPVLSAIKGKKAK